MRTAPRIPGLAKAVQRAHQLRCHVRGSLSRRFRLWSVRSLNIDYRTLTSLMLFCCRRCGKLIVVLAVAASVVAMDIGTQRPAVHSAWLESYNPVEAGCTPNAQPGAQIPRWTRW